MKYIVGLIAVAVLALGGFVFTHPSTQPVGATASPDVYWMTFFHQGLVVGGGASTVTDDVGATKVLTAAQVMNNHLIEFIATTTTTVDTPTAAQLEGIGLLQNAGDSYSLFIHASTTQITMAGNTGVTFTSASSTKIISAGTTGKVDFIRLPATESNGINAILVNAN